MNSEGPILSHRDSIATLLKMGGITTKTRHHSKTHTCDSSGIRVLRHWWVQNLSIIWQLKRGEQSRFQIYANDFHTACMKTLRVSSSYTQKAHSCIFFTIYFWYQKSLMIYKYACISVYSCTQACTRPSMTPRVSVVACVGLMECPKQKPPVGPDGQADLLNNTYKNQYIIWSFHPQFCFLFFKHSVLSMNIQHGQDLRHKDRSCPWETTRRKWGEKQGEECMEKAGTESKKSQFLDFL